MDNPLQYMKQCLGFQMPRTGETGKNHILVSSNCQKINLERTNKQNHIIVSTNKNNLERTSSEKGEEGKLADLIRSLRRRIRQLFAVGNWSVKKKEMRKEEEFPRSTLGKIYTETDDKPFTSQKTAACGARRRRSEFLGCRRSRWGRGK